MREEARQEARLIHETAECLRSLGRYHEALATAQQGVQMYPDYTDLYFLLGNLFFDLGRIKEAEQAFLACLERGEAPSDYKTEKGVGSFLAHYHLGLIYEMHGTRERAAVHYCEAARAGYAPAEVRARLLGRFCRLC